jgi:phosphopantetheine adenylyltransferase
MKSFHQFISEATAAADQAQRLGFQADGHGGWYDRRTNEFVAKTEGGKLKFYNKRQRIPGKDPNQTPHEKDVPSPSYNDPNLQQQTQPQPQPEPAPEQQPVVQEPQQEPQQPVATPPPVPKTKGTLTIAFGRFNPPHSGHLQLMDTAAASAEQEGSDYIIVPSRSQDKKKNPLDPDTKISIMRRLFPNHSERIVNDPANITIFDVLKKAHNDGYTSVRIVGGSDRVKEFEKLSNNYNGQLYAFDAIEVVSAGDEDPDSKSIEGISSSRMRLAVAENDFKTYYNHLYTEEPIIDPETGEQIMQEDPQTGEMIPATQIVPLVDRKTAKQMFADMQASMGINENWNLWEIAPKFDYQTLRENYVSEKIFQIGQLVENLNTGIVGRIIRRGTNYLIYVTESNMMFKSWITDVMETKKYTEVKMDRKMREPGKPNTLVGTSGFYKYVADMTPEAPETNLQYGAKPYRGYQVSNIREFINKYRK